MHWRFRISIPPRFLWNASLAKSGAASPTTTGRHWYAAFHCRLALPSRDRDGAFRILISSLSFTFDLPGSSHSIDFPNSRLILVESSPHCRPFPPVRQIDSSEHEVNDLLELNFREEITPDSQQERGENAEHD